MPRDKWTAFFLSLLVPGSGQFYAGRADGLFWLVAATGLGIASMWLPVRSDLNNFAIFGSTLLLCVCSAEHAKRQLEPVGRSWSPTLGTEAKTICSSASGRAVGAEIELLIAQPDAEVWRRVSDLPRFLAIDVFHEKVTLARRAPDRGVDLVLAHNAFGHRFLRFGRILKWQEGRGYAFSDLSARGPQHGFPHVFFIDVEDVSCGPASSRTRLAVTIRGRWTSRWIPVWVGRWWVSRVCREHARMLRNAM